MSILAITVGSATRVSTLAWEGPARGARHVLPCDQCVRRRPPPTRRCPSGSPDTLPSCGVRIPITGRGLGPALHPASQTTVVVIVFFLDPPLCPHWLHRGDLTDSGRDDPEAGDPRSRLRTRTGNHRGTRRLEAGPHR